MNPSNDTQFTIEKSLQIKKFLSEIEKKYGDLSMYMEKNFDKSICKLVKKRMLRSNFETYSLFYELVQADIGKEEADKIFNRWAG